MMKKNNREFCPSTIRTSIAGTVILAFALATLMACGGSGGGDLMAGGGIGGTGISIGEISAFGSVIVNDVDFDTQKVQVIVNGEPVGSGDSVVQRVLGLGMVVRVEGEILGNGIGNADRIVFNENVKGPVTSIEPLDSIVKKIVVLGQFVIVDNRTHFKNTDYDNLTTGDILQISGWSDGTGFIQATYVAKIKATDDDITVKGIITEVNDAQATLQINQLTIDFSGAELQGFADDKPSAGQSVVARGRLDANGILIAKKISLEDDLGFEDADDADIEGIVTQFSSLQDFMLGTTPVQTDEATSFTGIDPDEIGLSVRLRVKGALTAGILLADEVVAKDKVNIEGRIANVDPVRGEVEVELIGLSPLIIRITDYTKIFGDASRLDEIQDGQQIKMLGYLAGQDRVEATRLRVKDRATDKVKLQGPITAVKEPTIYVIGVAVDTSQIDNLEFGEDDDDDDDDDQIQDFFENIEVSQVINARGILSGSSVVWKEIELLDDD
jgi:hypothetical protein